MQKKEKIISIILKTIVIVAGTIGVLLNLSKPELGGIRNIFYFTIQSNIWIVLVCLVGLVLIFVNLNNQKNYIKDWMHLTKFVFTIAITITGLVFCCVLAPLLENAFNVANILTHIVVPIFSIADFFVYNSHFAYKTKHCFLTWITPLYYLAFSTILYVNKIEFPSGEIYPYFFMNWDSPAGAFNITSEFPYLGCMYYGFLLLGFVFLLSYIYVVITRKINKKSIKN